MLKKSYGDNLFLYKKSLAPPPPDAYVNFIHVYVHN